MNEILHSIKLIQIPIFHKLLQKNNYYYNAKKKKYINS